MIQAQASYTCPMHPQINLDHPGHCPICGMSLEKKASLDSDTREYRDMLRRFLIAAALTIPVAILSSFDMLPMVQLLLSTPVVFWAGAPFFERAYASFVNRSLNMFTLIALGIGAAYFSSAIALILPNFFPAFIYFEAASVITTLVLLGQAIELKAREKTGQALEALMKVQAKSAHKVLDGQEIEVAIDAVQPGDILRVKPGEKVPTDGIVIEGASSIDESLVTGEAMPVLKKATDTVIGSTVNQTGSFLMKALSVGKDTLLARIIDMVSVAQRSKAPIQKLADTVSGYFVPVVLGASAITFIVWYFLGPEPRCTHAFINAIAVLIIACPCALGLATPMSIMVGVGVGARMGILIKNADALQKMEQVTTVVMDKTGTLTEGKPAITKVVALNGFDVGEITGMAAAIELRSEHPLAGAIVHKARMLNAPQFEAEEFTSTTGGGVSGRVQGQKVLIGSYAFLQDNATDGLAELQDVLRHTTTDTVICIAISGKAAGCFIAQDPLKASTPHVIDELHRLGLSIIMLTGDTEQAGRAVAKELHIDAVYAGVHPQDKYAIIQQLQQKKQIVAMAGDGINDAPALAAADVGIAMGAGTEAAMKSASITLIKSDLEGIIDAIALSRATMRNIRQNLFFAFIYNLLGIPLAAGVLYPAFGILLNPMAASAAMTLSSVSIIINALRLRKNRRLPTPQKPETQVP